MLLARGVSKGNSGHALHKDVTLSTASDLLNHALHAASEATVCLQVGLDIDPFALKASEDNAAVKGVQESMTVLPTTAKLVVSGQCQVSWLIAEEPIRPHSYAWKSPSLAVHCVETPLQVRHAHLMLPPGLKPV